MAIHFYRFHRLQTFLARPMVRIGVVVGILGIVLPGPADVHAAALPEGFQEVVVFSGLTLPTAMEFSPDGRIFVTEKSGLIKVFDDLTDPSPEIFADLNVNVHNFFDRGLLGLALPPDFPSNPYVYVLYTHDAEIGGTAPRWGTPGVYSDPCPDPPGASTNGCVVSGRLSRLIAEGNSMVGEEDVLIEDWCQQFFTHTTGHVEFGPDGALYLSGGDGASPSRVDYGQDGIPLNPCGDPPGGVGAVLAPPTAEGGALRSQDLRTAGDPVSLDGAVLRVDPETGLALPDNPLFINPDPNARRIIAYGLRNPFRFTFRPGTNELWIGDVGWTRWEEINRILNPTDALIENFGWPCIEGALKQAGYDGANLDICESLYQTLSDAQNAFFSYAHSKQVIRDEICPKGSSSITGLEFQLSAGSPYPDEYDNALFFADYSRNCIWAMRQGANGLPDPLQLVTFVGEAASPVDLDLSPDGELYYVDIVGGTIRKIVYAGDNNPPVAVAAADPTSGPAPLAVSFDGTGSSDPDAGDSLSYAWDLDGDGEFDDASTATTTYTYTVDGAYSPGLKVTDSQGLFDTDSLEILVGSGVNFPPTATIDDPLPSLLWSVGDTIGFSGSATDPEDGSLPDSAFSWSVLLHHCDITCHVHPVQDFVGVSSGAVIGPDHEYPSYLEIQLTVTDSGGLQDFETVSIDPQTVQITVESQPFKLLVALGPNSGRSPLSQTVIVGSTNTISAPSPQIRGGATYLFDHWSDGGAQTHDIIAPSIPTTFSAWFVQALSLGD